MAKDIIKVLQGWIGYSEANGKHKQIIDIYNNHRPLAQGYKVKYTDEWCDTTISAAAIKAGLVELIGTECGVERHIQIFKQKGIWIEDGKIIPRPGDIITYNWDKTTQPNDGWADHIGLVEKVVGNMITVIEGNYRGGVGRRIIAVGNGMIRGYARPKYKEVGNVTKVNINPSNYAKEAIEWAKKEGVTDGSRLKDAATREEVIAMIYRARKVK